MKLPEPGAPRDARKTLSTITTTISIVEISLRASEYIDGAGCAGEQALPVAAGFEMAPAEEDGAAAASVGQAARSAQVNPDLSRVLVSRAVSSAG